jgi:nucleoside-diphosphate-sugar epimerase
VHVSDAGRLYRLALESGVTERAYHAVGEEGITFHDIAEAIGRKLDLPLESCDHDHFGWQSIGPGLLADIGQPDYYAAA